MRLVDFKAEIRPFVAFLLPVPLGQSRPPLARTFPPLCVYPLYPQPVTAGEFASFLPLSGWNGLDRFGTVFASFLRQSRDGKGAGYCGFPPLPYGRGSDRAFERSGVYA
jgi:hypothetical protein